MTCNCLQGNTEQATDVIIKLEKSNLTKELLEVRIISNFHLN